MTSGYETAAALKAAYDEGSLDEFKLILKERGNTKTYAPEKTVYNGDRNGLNVLFYILDNVMDREPSKLEFFEALLPYCKDVDRQFVSRTEGHYGEKTSALTYALSLNVEATDTKAKCIELLLKHGASVNVPTPLVSDITGSCKPLTPLLLAQEPEVIKLLAEAGADLHYVTRNGYNAIANYIIKCFPTPYFKSRQELKTECKNFLNGIKALLDAGASPNADQYMLSNKPAGGVSPLMAASSLKRYIYMVHIANPYDAFRVHWKTPELKQLYLNEIEECLVKATDMLLEAGADPFYKNVDGNDVMTVCGSYALLKKFLSLGCDILSHNYSGVSVFGNLFRNSAQYSDEDRELIIQEYLSRGGTVNDIINKDGETALFCFPSIMKLDSGKLTNRLLELGADVNHRDSDDNTPLLKCLFNCFYTPAERIYEFVKTLVEAGADLNAANKYGNTCLHYWAEYAAALCRVSKSSTLSREQEQLCLDILDYLVEHGADVNAQNDFGFTPAAAMVKDIIPMTKRTLCIPFMDRLIEHGADVLHLQDNEGYSVVDMIHIKKLQKVVTKLVEHHEELRKLSTELEEMYLR